jgi:hypothetical protein
MAVTVAWSDSPLKPTPKEHAMKIGDRGHLKTIIDRDKLMQLKTCAACGRPFTLGDPVVLACGAWEGPPALIHENEAVYDDENSRYVERRCYQAQR